MKRKNNYSSIILVGFRATGKSTLSSFLAEKLDWEYVEMDEKIKKKAGVSIAELTKEGTDWYAFRQLEYDVLRELLQRKNVVISAGGGVGVNTIYGQLEQKLLKTTDRVLIILLTASDATIAERIKKDELKKQQTFRPLIDEKKAKKVGKLLEKHKDDPKKQKQLHIAEIVKDSLEALHQRKPLYGKLADITIDTGNISPENAVELIIKTIT